MLVLILVGCAKEPATTMAMAPSPGGVSGASTSEEGDGQGGGVVGRGGAGVAGVDAGRGGGQDVARGGAGSDFAAGAGGAGQSGSPSMVAAARPQPKEFSPVTALQDIHFDFDRYEIRSEDAEILSGNVEWLRDHPRARILIEGHCDDRGTNEYNLALGNHRAEAAMKYLLAQGIAKSRMTTISYGEERPLCTEETEDCWAKNRRAHFLVKRQ